MAAKAKPTITRAERSAAVVKKILKLAAERVPENRAQEVHPLGDGRG
jgi:hypothetical protein